MPFVRGSLQRPSVDVACTYTVPPFETRIESDSESRKHACARKLKLELANCALSRDPFMAMSDAGTLVHVAGEQDHAAREGLFSNRVHVYKDKEQKKLE